MRVQLAAQRCQANAYSIGALPAQTPTPAVSVVPACAVPAICGADALDGFARGGPGTTGRLTRTRTERAARPPITRTLQMPGRGARRLALNRPARPVVKRLVTANA